MAARKKTPDILGELLGEKRADEGTPKREKPKNPIPGMKQEKETIPHRGRRKKTQQEASSRKAPIPRQTVNRQEGKMKQVSGKPKEVGHAESESPEGSEKNGKATFVAFKVAGRDYALPLGQVERALRMVTLLPVPEAPPWIAGLMNLHGRGIPVLDTRKRFGEKAKDPHPDDRLLMVRNPGHTFAVMVDEVNDVLEIPLSELEAPSGSLARSRPLKGIIRHEEKLILVLDPIQLEPEEALDIEQ